LACSGCGYVYVSRALGPALPHQQVSIKLGPEDGGLFEKIKQQAGLTAPAKPGQG
jgi:hypothetical protein